MKLFAAIKNYLFSKPAEMPKMAAPAKKATVKKAAVKKAPAKKKP